MQRNEVNAIKTEVLNILNAAQKAGKLQGYDISPAGGRFGSSGFDMKISITPRQTEAEKARIANTTTPEVLSRGFALPGTPVTCLIRGGDQQRGVIVRARRSRYLVKGIGGKYDGQEFTYPFNGVRLDTIGA